MSSGYWLWLRPFYRWLGGLKVRRDYQSVHFLSSCFRLIFQVVFIVCFSYNKMFTGKGCTVPRGPERVLEMDIRSRIFMDSYMIISRTYTKIRNVCIYYKLFIWTHTKSHTEPLHVPFNRNHSDSRSLHVTSRWIMKSDIFYGTIFFFFHDSLTAPIILFSFNLFSSSLSFFGSLALGYLVCVFISLKFEIFVR